jgi:hypothetical protein
MEIEITDKAISFCALFHKDFSWFTTKHRIEGGQVETTYSPTRGKSSVASETYLTNL